MSANCYICEEVRDSPLMQNICSCSNRSIHLCCQAELLKRIPTGGRCTVCLQPYTNVSMTHTKRISRTAVIMRAIHILFVVFFSYMAYKFVHDYIVQHTPTFCIHVCTSQDCRTMTKLCVSFTTLVDAFTILVACSAVAAISLNNVASCLITAHRRCLPLHTVERNFHVFDGAGADIRVLALVSPDVAYE